jgi:NitT/TauT family transport system substrate-binding protein
VVRPRFAEEVEEMAKFRIMPHGRLQEWVADEKGYFGDEGLDYEFVRWTLGRREHLPTASSKPELVLGGALEEMQDGRSCEVSSACHWCVNMAAASSPGRMWGGAYSVTPAGIYVPPESSIRRPEDLAGIEIGVGQHSGSHFSTLQSLEKVVPPGQVELRFVGGPVERMELMLDRKLDAATVFGAHLYVLEQQGFRKVADATFMIGFFVGETTSVEDMERYVRALVRAQRDIDLEPHRYRHYFLDELPERVRDMVDVRLFGTGERVVAEPYTRETFEATRSWLEQLGVIGLGQMGRLGYEEAVLV